MISTDKFHLQTSYHDYILSVPHFKSKSILFLYKIGHNSKCTFCTIVITKKSSQVAFFNIFDAGFCNTSESKFLCYATLAHMKLGSPNSTKQLVHHMGLLKPWISQILFLNEIWHGSPLNTDTPTFYDTDPQLITRDTIFMPHTHNRY